jgi:hypothetical protein
MKEKDIMIRVFMLLICFMCACDLWSGSARKSQGLCTQQMIQCLANQTRCPGDPKVAFTEASTICGPLDLSAPSLPDLRMPPDLQSLPDLQSPPDLRPSPDLRPPPDLQSPPPDLGECMIRGPLVSQSTRGKFPHPASRIRMRG